MNNGKRIPRVDEEDATGTQTSEAQTFSSALVSVCLSPLLPDASHGEECSMCGLFSPDTPMFIYIPSHQPGRKQRGNFRHDGPFMAQLLISCVLVINSFIQW